MQATVDDGKYCTGIRLVTMRIGKKAAGIASYHVNTESPGGWEELSSD